MSATVTLLATAAATVGTLSAIKAVKRRMALAEQKVEAVRRRHAAERQLDVLDLEPDHTGAYGVRPRPADEA